MNLVEIRLKDDNLNKEELQFINDIIYEEKSKIERKLFQNQTIAFIDSSQSSVDTETTNIEESDVVGKLLILTDEYIGKMGLDLIRGFQIFSLFQTT